MKLTKKSIFYLSLGAVYLGLVAAVVYIWMEKSAASDKLNGLRSEAGVIAAGIKAHADAAQKLSRAQKLVQDITARAVDPLDLVGNQQIFYSAESSAGVKIEVLRQHSLSKLQADTHKYSLLSYRTMAEGSYAQLGDFIAAILNSKTLLRLSSFSLQRSSQQPEGSSQLTLSLDVEILAK